jgi:hypothetical protein
VDEEQSKRLAKRISLNIRMDSMLYAALEDKRKAGWGFAQTNRNRSDVYNEMIGLGLQVDHLRKELGEHTFSEIWALLNDPKVPWNKINLSKIRKLLA